MLSKEQFGRRYRRMHGRDLWQNPFVNTRSTVITELSKVYGYDQHSIGIWLGNTPLIQHRHYLQIMDDDPREAMCNWRDSKKSSSKGSRTDGSHLSAMVFRALRKVCPELVPAAEKHAADIAKIGLNGMFESPEVPQEEKPSVQSRGGPSSGGGTRTDYRPHSISLARGATWACFDAPIRGAGRRQIAVLMAILGDQKAASQMSATARSIGFLQ